VPPPSFIVLIFLQKCLRGAASMPAEVQEQLQHGVVCNKVKQDHNVQSDSIDTFAVLAAPCQKAIANASCNLAPAA